MAQPKLPSIYWSSPENESTRVIYCHPRSAGWLCLQKWDGKTQVWERPDGKKYIFSSKNPFIQIVKHLRVPNAGKNPKDKS